MGRIEEAIKKINDEVQKNHSNQYLVLVGEHIIDQITTETAAEQILKKGKNLQGALSSIQSRAAKYKSGGVAVVEDKEVYAWAREYFDLDEVAKTQTIAKESPKKKGICLDFNDFL